MLHLKTGTCNRARDTEEVLSCDFFLQLFFGKQNYEFRVQGLWDEVLSCDFFQKIKVDCDENFFLKRKNEF